LWHVRFKRLIAMRGLHCTADLSRCPLSQLLAHDALLTFALGRIEHCGLQAVAQQSYVFPASPPAMNGGFTLTILLAESHVCVHTWPELLGVTLDVYVCNMQQDNSHKAQQLIQDLIAWFDAGTVQMHRLLRG
jgi:S-adenosylmethionine decarboxylase